MLSDLQRSCGFGQGPRRRRKERRSPAVRAPPPWGTIPCPWLPTSLVLRPRALVRCSCREQTLARSLARSLDSPILSLPQRLAPLSSSSRFGDHSFLCASSSSSLHPPFIFSSVLACHFHPYSSSFLSLLHIIFTHLLHLHPSVANTHQHKDGFTLGP